jgi:hypothetical protein
MERAALQTRQTADPTNGSNPKRKQSAYWKLQPLA